MVLAFVHLYTLFMIAPIFNSMMRIDRSLIEAARDAGASPWQTFRHVLLPMIGPSLVGVGMFGFTLSWDDIARSSQAIDIGQISSADRAKVWRPYRWAYLDRTNHPHL